MENMQIYKIGSMRDVATYFGSHSVIGPLVMAWYLNARTYGRTLTEGAAGMVEKLFALDNAKAACLVALSHYGSRGGSVAVDEAEGRSHDDELLPDFAALLDTTPMLVGHDMNALHDMLNGAVSADQVAVVFLPPTKLLAIVEAMVAQDGESKRSDYTVRLAAMLETDQLMLGFTHFDQDSYIAHGERWENAKTLAAQRKAALAKE